MFASNFTADDKYITHLRGEDNLTAFSQNTSPVHNHTMTNYFCKTCGTLMYRVGSAFPGMKIGRIGTIDDFNLHETKFRPQVEQFTKDRANWLQETAAPEKAEAMYPFY